MSIIIDRIDTMVNELRLLKRYMEDVAGQWNGDNPGIAEDRAHCANDIIAKSDELIELLTEFNGY